MNARVFARKWRIVLIGLAAALALPGAALAQEHGGNRAGFGMHAGVGMASGGYHDGGGGFHNEPGGFGGPRGYHGPGPAALPHGGFQGPVFRGPGSHPGFYGHGYYRPRFYGGLALGAFVATLPLYYDTYWWGGVPYYYYDDTYLRWDDSAQEYQAVTPPAEVAAEASQAPAPATTDLFAYPTKGQSEEQQKTDRYECHSWAVTQSGYDPTAGAAADATKSEGYQRADAACLTGRGYSVQ
jgi:hypothetical protein